MSESDLPDDPAQWPRDPYALLGVMREVDRRELRRAYVRLIRRFKPEHFPEQFRRIRDAYESLDGYLQYREQFGQHEEEIDEQEPAAPAERNADSKQDADDEDQDVGMEAEPATNAEDKFCEPAPREERTRGTDPVATVWLEAVEGRPAEAYRRLQVIVEQRPGDAELYARLYWLLALDPGLDPQRRRQEWLTAGLRATSFDPRLAELYDRELQADPEECLQPRCRKLLEWRTPTLAWARVVARCWEYAGLLGHWRVFAKDIEVLRAAVADTDHALWMRLLLAGTEQLLWQEHHEAYEELSRAWRQELDKYGEEHWELSGELDRCDFLAELTAGWRKLKDDSPMWPAFAVPLCELLRRSWVLPFPAIQAEMLALLRPLVEMPRRALQDLDSVQQASSVVLHQFHSLVEALARCRRGFVDDACLSDIAHAGALSVCVQCWDTHENARLPILFHCLDRGISLDRFQAAAKRLPFWRENSEMANQIQSDLPLRCLITACLAFWA